MLTLYPSLIVNMDDGHLIRSLECEPSIMRTPVELELMVRCERLAEMLIQTTVSGQLSILMLIEWLEHYGIPVVSDNTDGIVAAIKTALENSYVEL